MMNFNERWKTGWITGSRVGVPRFARANTAR